MPRTPFDPDRCPIPPIARIPAAPLIVDDSVPEPPEEIIDCLTALTPLPSEPVTPCPTIRINGRDAAEIPISFTSLSLGRLRIAVVQGDDCTFDFNVDMAIPCGPITVYGDPRAGRSLVAQAGWSSVSLGTILMRAVPLPGCAFDIQAEALLPSPGYVAVTEAAGVGPRSGFTLGFGFVTLYRLNKFTGAMTAFAAHVKVYNNMSTSVGGSRHVQLTAVDGALMVSAEDC